jgi:isoleucyl-tRNA synthetase
MGSFYLDIIKDRQYTTQTNSVARRSAQTALYHIVEAMCRWMAPILSFTAEEIWQQIPGKHGDSVLLETWYDDLFELDNNDTLSMDSWLRILETRSAVSKQLETLRGSNQIGSSLDAEVTLFCDGSLQTDLNKLDDELRFVLITSEADTQAPDATNTDAVMTKLDSGETLGIYARASTHTKCIRCWHHREDVGKNSEHPELCGRCVENVAGSGEQRRFA